MKNLKSLFVAVAVLFANLVVGQTINFSDVNIQDVNNNVNENTFIFTHDGFEYTLEVKVVTNPDEDYVDSSGNTVIIQDDVFMSDSYSQVVGLGLIPSGYGIMELSGNNVILYSNDNASSLTIPLNNSTNIDKLFGGLCAIHLANAVDGSVGDDGPSDLKACSFFQFGSEVVKRRIYDNYTLGAISTNSTTVNRTLVPTYIYKLTKEEKMSANDFTSDLVSVYPNPTSDYINISTDVDKIEIFDTMGRKVHQDTSNSTNIAHLPKGIYIVQVTKDNAKLTKRISKN